MATCHASTKAATSNEVAAFCVSAHHRIGHRLTPERRREIIHAGHPATLVRLKLDISSYEPVPGPAISHTGYDDLRVRLGLES